MFPCPNQQLTNESVGNKAMLRIQEVDPGPDHILLGPTAVIIDGDEGYNVYAKTWALSGIPQKGVVVTVERVLSRTDLAGTDIVAYRRRKLTWDTIPEPFRRLAEEDLNHVLFLGFLRVHYQIVPPPEVLNSLSGFKAFLKELYGS